MQVRPDEYRDSRRVLRGTKRVGAGKFRYTTLSNTIELSSTVVNWSPLA